MTTIKLKDYDVQFPYEKAYDLQVDYMEKVITCLDEGRHGVLESPTGTGKTLSLFAPVTTWMTELLKKKYEVDYDDDGDDSDEDKSQKKKTKVFYTTRTHSQIAQACKEVRKCNIKDLTLVVIGSRDFLCINDDILNEKEFYIKNTRCKELVAKNGSKFYKKDNFKTKYWEFFKRGEIKDIEDLVQTGKGCKVCPYFMSKEAYDSADIILLPYKYIFDGTASANFDFKDSVIIFDEGHNVPNECEESFQFEVSSYNLFIGINSVEALLSDLDTKIGKGILECNNGISLEQHSENADFIMETLHDLSSMLNDLPSQKKGNLLQLCTITQALLKFGITKERAKKILKAVEELKKSSDFLNLSNGVLTIFHLLSNMLHCLYSPVLELHDQKTIDISFKCSVTEEEEPRKLKKLNLFCFNPSFGFQALLRLEPRSVIITSGTLTPLDTFIYELSLPGPVITLENPHIAKKSQVPFMVLGTGVGKETLDGSFKNRSRSEYMISLGNTLTNLIMSIPDGVLMLFSSYAMLNNLKKVWETNGGIWKRLNDLKRVFIEPHGKDDFINCMENFKRALDSGNGAILMGVLRGKISEGMDFKDQYCRAVFIIAVPYPPISDPRVIGKEKFAESFTYVNPKTKQIERLYESYLQVEAMKTTNQAIGRVIRHSHDYGAIILVDHRFSDYRLFRYLSSWIRESGQKAKNFPEAKRILGEFFKNVHNGELGVPEIRSQNVTSNGCPIAANVPYEIYDVRREGMTLAHLDAMEGIDFGSKRKSQENMYTLPGKSPRFRRKFE